MPANCQATTEEATVQQLFSICVIGEEGASDMEKEGKIKATSRRIVPRAGYLDEFMLPIKQRVVQTSFPSRCANTRTRLGIHQLRILNPIIIIIKTEMCNTPERTFVEKLKYWVWSVNSRLKKVLTSNLLDWTNFRELNFSFFLS